MVPVCDMVAVVSAASLAVWQFRWMRCVEGAGRAASSRRVLCSRLAEREVITTTRCRALVKLEQRVWRSDV